MTVAKDKKELQKYQFVILFNEAPEDLKELMGKIEGISSLYVDHNQQAEYSYKVFAFSRNAKDIFIKEFADLIGEDMKAISFSMFPRRVSSEEMVALINGPCDPELKEQLSEYERVSLLVKNTLKHLNINAQQLANLIDSKRQDIYNWIKLNAKPDKLKIIVLQYLLNCKDLENDKFVNFLKGVKKA
ncbi:hypothetical protein [Francisella philomiragia]|uniref:hypothetical protein n=1 Tax=Francisella philomiragia TaxID=28110 RepID=UPI0019030F80|nr:hypothetical protein [Francisella philomiragia]MBK2270189.1 hypothetical protein [Francisella philomiragia]MBK2275853.1 hypothetical protein [Francisella philomiragia]MBK2305066.1 hypothetical protein [Francisella philomiragia]